MHFSILMDIGNRGPGDADKSQDPCLPLAWPILQRFPIVAGSARFSFCLLISKHCGEPHRPLQPVRGDGWPGG